MRDVYQLEPFTQIDRAQSYVRSYPHILAHLASCKVLTERDFICGAHMVYGWMPTILEIHATESVTVPDGVSLLQKARAQGQLSCSEIQRLAQLVNRSVVGASKLLHFVNPEAFAIWDSRIYSFIYEQAPHQNRVNNSAAYERYLMLLQQLRQDERFPAFHASINQKMGYPVSALRALEVVMFLNAQGVPATAITGQ
ncbi:hypothetical protein [Aquipseudomonas alcaligenes]|uniref:hypothetical protein n=1 Tax=Aquipseudomonas alcaligenes TaxID=43263 RepID=UPI003749569F